jgi:hypothetical protein
MDRNSLLTATRAEFLQLYLSAFDALRPLCIETAFQLADTSRSSTEQHHLLTARGVLMQRHGLLKQHLQNSMAHLLNRSLQTTYSTERPVFSAGAGGLSLSLVDTNDFEDTLQLVAFTDKFRRESDEQLRDLNIRVAVLFGQDDIKERENPFRPYLIARALSDAAENMALPTELAQTLSNLMAEAMTAQVDWIYAGVNAFLSARGVAAQLPLKIKKTPDATPIQPSSTVGTAIDTAIDDAPPTQAPAMPRMGQQAADANQASIDEVLRTISSMANNAARQAASPSVPSGAASQMTGGGHEEKIDKLLSMMQQYSSGVAMADASLQANASPMMSASPPVMMSRLLDNLRNRAAGGQAGVINNTDNNSVSHAEAGSSANHSDAPAPTHWLNGVQKVGLALRQFFAGENSGAGGVAMPRVLTVALVQNVDDLLRTQTPTVQDMTAADGQIRNVLLERRASLIAQTEVVDEQMTIDVVAMLFEFILKDHRVPAEVRAQLGRLQFLVLKMALRDATLLTQKGHPVRLLINRIGTISVGLKQIDPSSERVGGEICRIVESLLDNATQQPKEFSAHFARMLDDFDSFVAVELRKNDEQINLAVLAVEEIKNRTLRFAHISAQMAELLSDFRIDAYLYSFLTDVWVQVIEQAEVRDLVRAQRFRALVPDLIWSLAPKTDSFDRGSLSAILPIMINTLRDGMASISWSQDKQQTLLDWLFEAHGRALRTSVDLDAFQVPSLLNMHNTFESLLDQRLAADKPLSAAALLAAEKALKAAAVAQAGAVVQDFSQLAENEVLASLALDDIDSVDMDEAGIDRAEDESVSERLYNGVSIEIKLSAVPMLAKLSWMSEDAGNLLLSLDEQALPMMMSLRAFKRLYNRGRVRFLEDDMLFERAVKSLLDSAEQMDMDEIE